MTTLKSLSNRKSNDDSLSNGDRKDFARALSNTIHENGVSINHAALRQIVLRCESLGLLKGSRAGIYHTAEMAALATVRQCGVTPVYRRGGL